MRVPDEAMATYYRLLLDEPPAGGTSARDAKRALARGIIARFHGDEAAAGGRRRASTASSSTSELPDEIEEARVRGRERPRAPAGADGRRLRHVALGGAAAARPGRREARRGAARRRAGRSTATRRRSCRSARRLRGCDGAVSRRVGTAVGSAVLAGLLARRAPRSRERRSARWLDPRAVTGALRPGPPRSARPSWTPGLGAVQCVRRNPLPEGAAVFENSTACASGSHIGSECASRFDPSRSPAGVDGTALRINPS